MEPVAHRTHEGPGVARRAAHHERQRAERAAEEVLILILSRKTGSLIYRSQHLPSARA